MFFDKGDCVRVKKTETVRETLHGKLGTVIKLYRNRNSAAICFDGFADLLFLNEITCVKASARPYGVMR